MSLRLRAVLITGIALSLLWASAAAWLTKDLHATLDRTLDQRLAMSARMVAGLMERSVIAPEGAREALSTVIEVGNPQGIACQIRSLRGEILASTGTTGLEDLGPPPTGFAHQSINGQQWRTFTVLAGQHIITTSDRIDERNTLFRDILLTAGVPFLIAVLGGLLALWFGIRRGLAPLDELRDTLHKRGTHGTYPIPEGNAPGELRPVIGALNDLLGRLSRALTHQRAFTDAAAHELRTPLTGIDTHLQVAGMTEGPAAAQSLERAREGVLRLRRTLDQMMALARIETPGDHSACPSVVGTLEDVLSHLPAAARQRIETRWPHCDAHSPIPPSLLDTAVRNLLENALRYSPAEQPVGLTLECLPGSAGCRITVTDQGPGLTEDEIARAGQRFWRGDPSLSGDGGSGLGISIVRAICDRYGGSLTLRNRDGRGLVAELKLPATPLG